MVGLALLTVGSRPAAAVPAVVQVSVTHRPSGDVVSLTARRARLGDVLTEMARQAGFEVGDLGPLAGHPVSVELRAVPLERGLERLLLGQSFALVYRRAPDGADRLSRILVVAPGQGGVPRIAPTEPDTEPSESASPAAVDAPPRILPRDAETFDPDGPLELLLPLAQHPDHRTRIAALEALSRHGAEARVRRAILEAMRDDEPRVRNVAVGLLGAHLSDWPGAEDAVWAAVRDVMAPIRGTALAALWEGASLRAPEAVRLALQDVDAGVRALAAALASPTAGTVLGDERTAGEETAAVTTDPGEIPTEVPAE